MSNETQGDLLRQLERVLDQYHRRFSLLQRPKPDALRQLLRTVADVVRMHRERLLPARSDDSRLLVVNEGVRGLCHCLRWVYRHCPERIITPRPAFRRLQDEALELIRWGVTYDHLCSQHSAYSQGLIDVEINKAARTIRFLPKQDIEPAFFVTQIESRKAADKDRSGFCPDEQLKDMATPWLKSVTPTTDGFTFDDRELKAPSIRDLAIRWMAREVLPELCDHAELGYFSVGEARRVLAVLYVWARFYTWFEDCSDDCSRPLSVPSFVSARPKQEFVEWLSDVSEVSPSVVGHIVTLLTFDQRNFHATIAKQPLLEYQGQIILSPRVLALLNMAWGFVGALNLVKTTQEAYSCAINRIEDETVTEVAKGLERFCGKRMTVLKKPSLPLGSTRSIRPDIVVFGRKPHEGTPEIIAMDVKCVLAPFSALDVAHDLQEFYGRPDSEDRGWRQQLEDYVEVLRDNPTILERYGCRIDKYVKTAVYGMIIFRDPFPVPLGFPADVCGVDWPSLKRRFIKQPPYSIREMYQWARQRPDVQIPENLRWKYKQEVVGDWTYSWPVLRVPQSEG